MGNASRIALLFRSNANRVLDRAEDPREVLDYSYERQQEMLTKVRRGLAEHRARAYRQPHPAQHRRRQPVQQGRQQSAIRRVNRTSFFPPNWRSRTAI